MPILPRHHLPPLLQQLRLSNRTIGYTSGTFDLLHRGHVEYLELARNLCDVLVVGVNSDSSVRAYKGPTRPVVSGEDRARVVAGLRSVDYVFLFDETNNNRSIEMLRPDVYIKAGDYTKDKLSSAPIIEAYGGRVELVPFVPDRSTSAIIERIGLIAQTGSVTPRSLEPRPALFLDRDGTIIDHVEYLHDPAKVTIKPGAFSAIRRFQDAGYRIIMVTNQPGISLGYFTVEDLFRVNARILRESAPFGVVFDKLYFCPHSNVDRCSCRKPLPGMLERAVTDLRVLRQESIFVGDSGVDIEAAREFGCRSVLLREPVPSMKNDTGGSFADVVASSWDEIAALVG
jgi:rfaE bifunctional protein nucleotidyltransferase chain/domain